MESPRRQHPPFEPSLPIETLKSDGFNINAGRIHALGKNFIVRRFPIEGYGASTPEAQAALKERMDAEKKADQFFSELKAYGINVVPYRRVIGHDSESPSQEALYTITDRIHGKALIELSPEEIKTYATQIDETFAGIFSYLKKIATEGGVFHSELDPTQFMAGINARHPEQGQNVFLVDIDPLCFEYNPQDKSEKFDGIFSHAALAPVSYVELMAKKSGLAFPKTYAAAIEMIKVLTLNNKDDQLHDNLREMKKYGSEIVTKALEQNG